MITLILCAAGSGVRTAFPQNKVLHGLEGLPALCYSLSAFAPYAGEILVACRPEDEEEIVPLLAPFPQARCVHGGKTRFFSVLHALEEASGEIVLVHDAARPFVTKEIIEACIQSVHSFGSGICSLPSTDTTVLTENGYTVPPRGSVFTVQTPQGFRTDALKRAYHAANEAGMTDFTDESSVYAAFCAQPHLFAGDRANRKLTYAEDFVLPDRVGFGTDTHAFAHQNEIDAGIARLNLNYIPLCGVHVPSDRAIEAHSDGDVPVHALMDALLSAIGARDIGFHFPPDDPSYAHADSMKLLETVMKMVHGGGFFVKNASVTILCEKPRLSSHIDAMRQNLRSALGCEAVSVAAGTNEKLGYIGEGRGITAFALVLLAKLPQTI